MTALCPSERSNQTYWRRRKELTDWAQQTIAQLRRWLPGGNLVTVGDSSFAAIELLAAVSDHVTMGPPRWSPAFGSTDPSADSTNVVRGFVRRWYTQKFLRMEVTFEEARRHLGVETQQRWSDGAIVRTTPCLFGPFFLVTLMANR